jgi:hypothetical protein
MHTDRPHTHIQKNGVVLLCVRLVLERFRLLNEIQIHVLEGSCLEKHHLMPPSIPQEHTLQETLSRKRKKKIR